MNNLSIRKMNELSKKKKKKKGFTLVELIIVIAIIAILASIAIPKFGQITRDANIKADIATAKNIHSIAAQLVAENVDISDAGKIKTAITARLDGVTAMPKTKLDNVKEFTATYNKTSGDIKITDGSTEIYPNSSEYGKEAVKPAEPAKP